MSQSVTQTRFHKKNRFPGPNPQHHLDKTVILLTFLIENVMLPIGTCRQGYSIARLELLRRAKTIVGLNVERTGHEPPGRVILREGKWMDAFLLRLLNHSNIWAFLFGLFINTCMTMAHWKKMRSTQKGALSRTATTWRGSVRRRKHGQEPTCLRACASNTSARRREAAPFQPPVNPQLKCRLIPFLFGKTAHETDS
jgi:hypothetical protein